MELDRRELQHTEPLVRLGLEEARGFTCCNNGRRPDSLSTDDRIQDDGVAVDENKEDNKCSCLCYNNLITNLMG